MAKQIISNNKRASKTEKHKVILVKTLIKIYKFQEKSTQIKLPCTKFII